MRSQPLCYSCDTYGHMARECEKGGKKKAKRPENKKRLTHRADKAESKWSSECSTDKAAELTAQHALSSSSHEYRK